MALALVVGVCAQRPAASAEDDRVLGRMLREGHSFQARAGAASVIGRRRDAERRPDLEGALGDQHPVVRAAAASALGRIGSRSSLPPLHGVADHDRVQDVAFEARAAIDAIQCQPDPAGYDAAPQKSDKPRYGLVLGEMLNRSRYSAPELIDMLSRAIERNVSGLPGAAVFDSAAGSDAGEAQEHGLALLRLDGSLTLVSAARADGQLSVHVEVSLLVMDQPTGALRTLLRGAATGVELSSGVPAAQERKQELKIARRVVNAAVRSALRNADDAIADAAR